LSCAIVRRLGDSGRSLSCRRTYGQLWHRRPACPPREGIRCRGEAVGQGGPPGRSTAFRRNAAPAVSYLRAGIAAGRDFHIRRPPVPSIARSWPAAPRRSEPCNNVPDARLSAVLNREGNSNGLKLPRATASLLLDERNATRGPSPPHQSNYINVVTRWTTK
jgi:hypothetical protein